MTNDNRRLRLAAENRAIMFVQIRERKFSQTCWHVSPQTGGFTVMERPRRGLTLVSQSGEVAHPLLPAFGGEKHAMEENDLGFHASSYRGRCANRRFPWLALVVSFAGADQNADCSISFPLSCRHADRKNGKTGCTIKAVRCSSAISCDSESSFEPCGLAEERYILLHESCARCW